MSIVNPEIAIASKLKELVIDPTSPMGGILLDPAPEVANAGASNEHSGRTESGKVQNGAVEEYTEITAQLLAEEVVSGEINIEQAIKIAAKRGIPLSALESYIDFDLELAQQQYQQAQEHCKRENDFISPPIEVRDDGTIDIDALKASLTKDIVEFKAGSSAEEYTVTKTIGNLEEEARAETQGVIATEPREAASESNLGGQKITARDIAEEAVRPVAAHISAAEAEKLTGKIESAAQGRLAATAEEGHTPDAAAAAKEVVLDQHTQQKLDQPAAPSAEMANLQAAVAGAREALGAALTSIDKALAGSGLNLKNVVEGYANLSKRDVVPPEVGTTLAANVNFSKNGAQISGPNGGMAA